MKKAFDANVSRAKPRMRLGALLTAESAAEPEMAAMVNALAEQVAQEGAPSSEAPAADATDLGVALKARAHARASRPTAAEAFQEAIAGVDTPHREVVAAVERVLPQAHAEPPPAVIEVQTAPAPSATPLPEGGEGPGAVERRERLRERLKAVRENPRPEPLPDTVAEAGVLAVERIAALQTELAKSRAMNLALAQDLEAARRQAERATEEARLRMDEAKRLASEMEGRVKLLSELERELESLEGERNDSLLALQDARSGFVALEREKQELLQSLAQKEQEISDSLAEEERLATELEEAQDSMAALRRSADALKGERDTLARQVSELTRERVELLEARKALEAVHRALSSATMH